MSLNATNSTFEQSSSGSNVSISKSDNLEWYLISSLIGFLVVSSNTVVIYTFTKKRVLLRQPTNKLLLSLSLSDCASGIVIVLHVIAALLPYFSHPTTSAGFTYRVITELVTTSSQLNILFHMCLLTWDRYLALFSALRYRVIASGKRMLIAAGAIWLASIIVSFIQLLWLYRVLDGEISNGDGQVLDAVECRYSIVVLVLLVLLPLVLIGAMYLRIFTETRKLLRHPVTSAKPALKKELRVTWVYTSMYILICLYSLPYFIMRLFIDLKTVSGEILNIDQSIIHSTTNVRYLMHFANPLIYSLRKSDIKNAISECVLTPVRTFIFCKNDVSCQIFKKSTSRSPPSDTTTIPRASWYNRTGSRSADVTKSLDIELRLLSQLDNCPTELDARETRETNRK